jgi:hypothetical protein
LVVRSYGKRAAKANRKHRRHNHSAPGERFAHFFQICLQAIIIGK